jgi:hypothetical protein
VFKSRVDESIPSISFVLFYIERPLQVCVLRPRPAFPRRPDHVDRMHLRWSYRFTERGNCSSVSTPVWTRESGAKRGVEVGLTRMRDFRRGFGSELVL